MKNKLLKNKENCIVKWVIFLGSFSWLEDFSKIWKLKKLSYHVDRNVWTSKKMLYARNYIFKKRIPNMRSWIIYILVQILLLGTALGRSSLCFFIFCHRAAMVSEGFTQPLPLPWKSFLRPWLKEL